MLFVNRFGYPEAIAGTGAADNVVEAKIDRPWRDRTLYFSILENPNVPRRLLQAGIRYRRIIARPLPGFCVCGRDRVLSVCPWIWWFRAGSSGRRTVRGGDSTAQAIRDVFKLSFTFLCVHHHHRHCARGGRYPPLSAIPSGDLVPIVSFIMGPGILVNSVFKDHWGRARPVTVEQFGGDLVFSPVWTDCRSVRAESRWCR